MNYGIVGSLFRMLCIDRCIHSGQLSYTCIAMLSRIKLNAAMSFWRVPCFVPSVSELYVLVQLYFLHNIVQLLAEK